MSTTQDLSRVNGALSVNEFGFARIVNQSGDMIAALLRAMTDTSELSAREKTFAFENLAKQLPKVDLRDVASLENELVQFDLDIKYHSGGGVFTGELVIPKGTILVGKVHKYENLNVMTKGELAVLVGDEIKRVKAPFVVVSPPGTKRIAYALEDTVWMTFHATPLTDVDEVEKHFIAQTEQEYIEFCKMLEAPKCG